MKFKLLFMFFNLLISVFITYNCYLFFYSFLWSYYGNLTYFELPELDFTLSLVISKEPLWSSFTLESLRVFIFVICFLTLLSLLGERGETRVLAVLVLLEVMLVSLATFIVLAGASTNFNTSSYYNTTLCILAAGGADTALSLALFMSYFKISGKITLK